MLIMEASSEDCSVKVAVHIRPLIGDERLHGCKECVTVVPGQPQVQIGPHSFTFDHVYGGGGSSSAVMFKQCIAPLVDGLFEGYNGTVFAYGQTGSGKTYTMGTGLSNSSVGVIPQVMNALFNKIETWKSHIEFQLHVSFIEILKEEVRDLLDSTSSNKSDTVNGHAWRATMPGRAPIQIRETSNGLITLAGSTEVSVGSYKNMAACLEQGLLNRATGSTNMNSQSSRSHAIFTITLEQMHKLQGVNHGEASPSNNVGEEYLCAKIHLVDLAGSERVKRTGSDGLRLKEGIYINKGLLALGNVISALGDEKKRKDGVHIPYRDSKLTRLLQDSLGGNSKTVMIACISPADINADETLNTLKYANRARNIKNKPVVNKDLTCNEMQRLRQRLEYLQAELSACRREASSDEVHVLKQRIAWLEATNDKLSQEVDAYRSRYGVVEHYEMDVHEGRANKRDGLKRGLLSIDSSDGPVVETGTGDSCRNINEEVAKEWEHTLLQNNMGKELNLLNERLEQKESEMKLFGWSDTEVLRQLFQKKITELEEQKKVVEQERDQLLSEIERLAACGGPKAKVQDIHAQKLKALEAKILDLKKKQESQVWILKQKQRSEEAAKRLQDEIQCIKSQKVKLLHKIKHEADQYRQWKASREKELLQLRKEGRRNEFERHKLQALNQRQKMVLQRKTEEAAVAAKKLKELLAVRKCVTRDCHQGCTAAGETNENTFQRWLDHELEVILNLHAVRFKHEKQSQLRATLVEELSSLRQEDHFSSNGLSPPTEKNGNSRCTSMSPTSRLARIASLDNMLITSTNALVAMASQLSDAKGRVRSYTSRGGWNFVRSMAEAKNWLEFLFNAVGDARCRLWEKELEIKEMKERMDELVIQLQQSEAQRTEIVRDQNLREQSIAIALATPHVGRSQSSFKYFVDDMSDPLSPRSMPAPKQLKYTSGIANGSGRESAAYFHQGEKMVPIGYLSMKQLAVVGQGGKLWRWKRSHHQWLLRFKWKWQKPWKLSELIKHCDEMIMRSRSRPHAPLDVT